MLLSRTLNIKSHTRTSTKKFSTSRTHSEKIKMSNSEAFVETLVARDVKDVFGIVGSAFMDALDLFPSADIRFIPVAHEQNAVHMADGYARVSGKNGVCIAQNGPGISNFVTGVAAAYHAHSPVVAITPEAGTMTKGLGGFQEMEQLPVFSTITKWQVNLSHPARMAEITGQAFDTAINENGPVQLNIARDYFYGVHEHTIPKPNYIERSAGGPDSLKEAAKLIAKAKNPVILAGAGVVLSNGVEKVQALAEYLGVPVATTYLHNDAFPKDHELMTGPLGYLGSKAAMTLISEADLVLAIGTRLGPFGTLPQYDFDYWPSNAKVVQIDCDNRKLGLVKPVDIAINGDARKATKKILKLVKKIAKDEQIPFLSNEERTKRLQKISKVKADWEAELNAMTEEIITTSTGMKPRQVLRELEKAMPSNAIVSTDIGNICSVANSYLRFNEPRSFLGAMTFGNCGYAFPAAMGAKVARPDKFCISYAGDGAWGMSLNEVMTCVRQNIPTTAVVFNNSQWGAEKKNQVIWFGDRYVGSNLGKQNYSHLAISMGAKGIRVKDISEVGDALRQAVKNQEEGFTTVLEMMVNKELGPPFRRDAMKLPHRLLQKYQSTNVTQESLTGQPTDLKN